MPLRKLLLTTLTLSLGFILLANAKELKLNSKVTDVEEHNHFLFEIPEPKLKRVHTQEQEKIIAAYLVYLNEKLRTNPKHSFLYVDKALFLQLNNDLENALKTSSQALALRKSAYAYYRKASIEFDLGLFDDVKSDCTEAIKLLPGTKAFHLLRLAACQSYISPSNEELEKIDELALLALLKADITNRENAVKNDKLTISFGTGAFDERNPEEPYCLFLYDSPCMKEDGSMLFSKVKD